MVAAVLGCWAITAAAQSDDPLPSWNDGPAKQAILEFVDAVTTEGGADYVAPEDRIATFDQDGTLWVEHPIYTQVVFALDRVVALAPEHPEWKTTEPFKTVLSGDKAAMAKLTLRDLEEIVFATHAGMSVEAFAAIAEQWTSKARNPRWDRLYIDLVYQPMEEVLSPAARERLSDLHRHRRRPGLRARLRCSGLRYRPGPGDRLDAGDRLQVRRPGPGRAHPRAEAGSEQQQLRQTRGPPRRQWPSPESSRS